ncbi:hypothetical protein LMTR3_27600 [Bradyrhizobium sp. LMTR 3]|nr:hypothetical protein LMTR3_27600 [Bradyrhizobium sp. LMTR 3]
MRNKRGTETAITPPSVEAAVAVAAVAVTVVVQERMPREAEVRAALAAVAAQARSMVAVKTIDGGEAAGPDRWRCWAPSSLRATAFPSSGLAKA